VLTPAERTIAGRVGAYRSWANTADPSARTLPARSAFMERFEREVDPENRLPEVEHARRAEAARRAYFTELALKSARARRHRKAAS
jgi:hypothetical protein